MSAPFAKLFFVVACCSVMFASSDSIFAQVVGGGGTSIVRSGVVGGVMIDSSGVISAENQVVDEKLRKLLEQDLQAAEPDINVAADLRMISLRGLENAITQSRDAGQALPNDVKYMAGLQRIEYVILDAANQDIIIAGPGEGWKLDAAGNVVGVNSGAPVIQLEDFLVAMRSVENARTGTGISVSIDPTEDGVRQLQQFYQAMAARKMVFDPSLQAEVEKAMGPHNISLTGVPADSRFSQVLVAADYKMKRMSMGLEPAPIEGLPSFMEMAAKKKVKSMKAAPRFWMECNYQPVAKTEDGSVWQIRGQGVKTLTQETHFDSDGKSKTSGKQNVFAVAWAELMTEKFEQLAAAEPAFRELRNVMDLSVIAAIIRKENLAAKVGLETPAILGLTDVIATPTWTVPKSVSTQCSFVRVANSWLVSASGGIQLDSWGIAGNTEINDKLASIATTATNKTADRWWWNGQVN